MSSPASRQTLGLLVRQVLVPTLAYAASAALAVALLVLLLTAAAGRAVAAGFMEAAAAHDGGAPRPLVLTRVDYSVRVVGPVATIDLEQEFVNDTPDVLEASYVFPLPESAAVRRFELQVGDRLLEGIVREKLEAAARFQQARAEGRRASLLEQHRPNAFQSRVTNLLPGDVVVVRIGFAMVVPFDDAVFRLRLPLVVSERFEPGTTPATTSEPVPCPSRRSARTGAPRLAITVHVDEAMPVARLDSPSHVVDMTSGQGGVLVTLADPDEDLDRDFLLEYALGTGHEPGAQAWLGPEHAGWREAMVLLSPPPHPAEAIGRPKEVLFVVDSSGSMQGGSMTAAQQAVLWCLEQLQPGDRFDVTDFDHAFTMLSPFAVDVEDEAMAQARAFVGRMNADGGTHLLPALAATLDLPPSPEHHRVVIVVTDGDVGNESEIAAMLEGKLGEARVFVLGIGDAPNEHLVRQVAEAGRGTAEIIGSGSVLEEHVMRLFARIESPLLWDVALDWGGAEVRDVYPERVPDLYLGLPVAVFARVRGQAPGSVLVTGETSRGLETLAAKVAGASEHEAIGALWGRARIRDLERQQRLAAAEPKLGVEARAHRVEDLRREIVETAVAHRLASSATSFVVVERERAAAPGGPTRHEDVACAEPASWPRTASRRPRALLTGLALLLFGIARIALDPLTLRVVASRRAA